MKQRDWINIVFFMFTPVIGIAGTAFHTWRHGFQVWMPLLTLAMYLAVGFSICAGYHRYFSHKSYHCSSLVQYGFAFFGAMAAQNSILWWSSGHRMHHQHVDRDWDPYNIRRGFWWAHIVWLFEKRGKPELGNVTDLLQNPVVLWQERWHRAILILGGFGIPALVGAAFGDPLGGLLWGGFLRLVIIHHTTFFVNSLAHSLGRPLYNAEVSARDNWFVALLTLGEGYHSFHHRFPADFRNGIRWYQWDPSKWLIRALHWTGLATDLRATPPPQIEQARLQVALRAVEEKIERADAPVADQIRHCIREALHNLEIAYALWRQHDAEKAETTPSNWRSTLRRARGHIRQSRREWKLALRMIERLPQVA
jgi:stearoyl-CoA desaturase (delta-9 desaturase)